MKNMANRIIDLVEYREKGVKSISGVSMNRKKKWMVLQFYGTKPQPIHATIILIFTKLCYDVQNIIKVLQAHKQSYQILVNPI